MRYFKLFDDLAPEGDTYRYDGAKWECIMLDGSWGRSAAGHGDNTAWLDFQVQCGIEGGNPNSKWEEIDEPA